MNKLRKENNYPIEPTGIIPQRLKCWFKNLDKMDKTVYTSCTIFLVVTTAIAFYMGI